MNIILIIILMAILMILAWSVFSSKTESVPENKTPAGKEQIEEPEKILRRRSADRAIEKEYPAEKIENESAAEKNQEREDAGKQIQLPFSANDIITDGSRFKLYKRALINSEIYAKRGDIETAVSLFKGVKERILDSGIRDKIESNINYLNLFRHRREEDLKKKSESTPSGQQGGELRVRIDGQVPQTINIGVSDQSNINTNEIIEKISVQIAKELGVLKNDIERIKSKPEEKFDLDDYADFSDLQHQFKNLKERFEELSDERVTTLKELNKLREMKDEVLEKDKQEYQSPENQEILKDIRREIDNLSTIKHSLDSLHVKIEDISGFQIPESNIQPSISQAKYNSPLPENFDPQPVLQILDRINQFNIEEKSHAAEAHAEVIHHEQLPDDIITEKYEPEEVKAETYTFDGLDNIRHEHPAREPEIKFEITEKIGPLEIDAEAHAIDEPDKVFHEPIFKEPEIKYEITEKIKPLEFDAEAHTIDELDKVLHEPIFKEPETKFEITEKIRPHEFDAEAHTIDELDKVLHEPIFKEPEIRHEEAHPEEITTDEILRKKIQPTAEDEEKNVQEIKEDRTAEASRADKEEKKASSEIEKEKEIEKHIDEEEDPNAFDLLSDIGKVKDDSTLTDEDIFEKILKDEKNKNDDSAFEIIGDVHKEDQEVSFNDSRLDGKMKAEQDFYRKFIKADRIKKRELPILKVTYDFKKLPDEFSLSREKNILEYSFYKYKPMLQKADEFIKHRHVKDAINYYKVVLDQNIPIEFKAMIKKNIRDLTEYLEKYLSTE